MAEAVGKLKVKMFSDNVLLAYLIGKNKISDAPKKTEYYTKHKEIIIGIGDDHIASLTLDEDALEALYKLIEIASKELVEKIKSKEGERVELENEMSRIISLSPKQFKKEFK